MMAQGNTLLDLQPLMPKVLESLPNAKPGEAMVVSRET
jgi:hypothetical protein